VLLPLLLLCACAAGAEGAPCGVAGGEALPHSPEPKRDSSEGRRARSEAEGDDEDDEETP
jgi:hypothetical protein